LQHVLNIFNKRFVDMGLPRNTDPLSVLYAVGRSESVLALLTSLDDAAIAKIGQPEMPSLVERLAAVHASKLPCFNCGGDHDALVEHGGVELCTGCLGAVQKATSVAERVAAIEAKSSASNSSSASSSAASSSSSKVRALVEASNRYEWDSASLVERIISPTTTLDARVLKRYQAANVEEDDDVIARCIESCI
jgi:hypothetical protein